MKEILSVLLTFKFILLNGNIVLNLKKWMSVFSIIILGFDSIMFEIYRMIYITD